MALRVALDSSVRRHGGVSRHLLDLAGGLEASGAEVFLSLPAAAEDVKVAAWKRGLRIADVACGRQVDIVHFHLGNTFDRSAVARMVRCKPAARIVVTEHLPHSNASDPSLPYGGKSRIKTELKTAFKCAQFALADRTIVLSNDCLEFIATRYRSSVNRLRLVPNGIPEPSNHGRTEWGGNRVVAVGGLEVQKGFDVLTKAAAIGRDWRVEIFGDGPSRVMLEQLAGVEEVPVRFRGWADHDEMAIDTAAVVCLPSRWEALPYVALEAMWAECPIVASRVDGLTDLVVNGETGLLVEPEDEVALARAISRLIDDPDYAERLGRGGRRRAAEHFSYQGMVDGVLQVYGEVLHR